MQTQDVRQQSSKLRNIATWAMILACGCSSGGGTTGTSGTDNFTLKFRSVTVYNRLRIDKESGVDPETGEPTFAHYRTVMLSVDEIADSTYQMEGEEILPWNSVTPVKYRATGGVAVGTNPPIWFGDEYEFELDGTKTTIDFDLPN